MSKDVEDNFTPLLQRIDKKAKGIVNRALQMVADELLRLSVKQVPHDKGMLQASGVSRQQYFGEMWVVGYHTEYAAEQHENLGYSHDPGRKAKYLEDPLKQNMSKWRDTMTKISGGMLHG